MQKIYSENDFPQSLRWQNVDKFLKKFMHRLVSETAPCNTIIDEHGNKILKFFSRKRFICWYSHTFEINEFYHTFGTPGIWFHGYLPKSEFGEPEFDYAEPDYGYYDFEIKSLEHFKQILEAMIKADEYFASAK